MCVFVCVCVDIGIRSTITAISTSIARLPGELTAAQMAVSVAPTPRATTPSRMPMAWLNQGTAAEGLSAIDRSVPRPFRGSERAAGAAPHSVAILRSWVRSTPAADVKGRAPVRRPWNSRANTTKHRRRQRPRPGREGLRRRDAWEVQLEKAER